MSDRPAPAPAPLPVEQLRWRCDPDRLPFETTSEIVPIEGVVGQPGAVEALAFGLNIDAPGQNVFVRGLVGTGRLSLVKAHLEQVDDGHPTSPDRVLVHHFDHPDRPRLLTLPRGTAHDFATAMEGFRRRLRDELADAIDPEALAETRRQLEAEANAAVAAAAKPLEEKLKADGLAMVMVQDQAGQRPLLVPLVDGQPATPDVLPKMIEEGALTQEQLGAAQEAVARHQAAVEAFAAMARGRAQALRERLGEALTTRAREVLEGWVAPLAGRFPATAGFLAQVVDDVVTHRLGDLAEPTFERLYAVNVLLGHEADARRPVLVENHPTVQTLLGSIDPVVLPDGTAHAAHMAVHAGSLLRADGGTLVLDARDVATTPGAWQALVRTLRSGQVELTPDEVTPSTVRAPGLKPDPIPVSVKVVLLGDPAVYFALDAQDPDFPHLFKVLVDFDDTLSRTDESLGLYAGVLARIGRDASWPPLHRSAVAALVEHAARIAARPDALTARFGRVADLAHEAVWVARRDAAGHEGPIVVTGDHVHEAIRRTKHRADGAGRRFRNQLLRGTLRIDTEGAVVGQVNGLAVMTAGQLTYGFPSRITATVGPGRRGTVNIEGEASLSGAIHTKGFHILGGLLRHLLRTDHPLVFDGSIAFEQSYGGIDGDSASGAEFCCLVSALTDLPLRQDLAMTGAIDQKGHVQAIGAANEKVEGFFDACAVRGLTGSQGVLVPTANVGDLMLRADVAAACADGRFAVYGVERIEEALALLLDTPADTVVARAIDAAKRLWEMGGREH